MFTLNVTQVKKRKPPSPYEKKAWDNLKPCDPDNHYPDYRFTHVRRLCFGDETLETIAGSTPCKTWQELVRYNWGLELAVKEELLAEYVNWYLENYCECWKATGSDMEPGHNYVFSDLTINHWQAIIVPVPRPETTVLASTGPSSRKTKNTVNSGCPELIPHRDSLYDSCKIMDPPRCCKHPRDLSPGPSCITVPRSESKAVNRQTIKATSVVLSLVQRRISDYKGLNAGAYTWINETLYVEFLRETVTRNDIETIARGRALTVRPSTDEDDDKYLVNPKEIQSVAAVVTELELAGRLAEVVVRGYPDCDEANANKPEELPLRRAEYIVNRLKSGFGLLQSPVKNTPLGCTGYYCTRPADPEDRAAAVEVITKYADPAPAPANDREDESRPIHTYSYNWYEGPDLGPDFKYPMPGLSVVRTSLTLGTESATQVATSPNEVQSVRHDAMIYFDSFMQLLNPGSAGPAGEQALLSTGGSLLTIYNWINGLKHAGKGPSTFPRLGDAYKFKDLANGEWQTNDKQFKTSDAIYTVKETAATVACAAISRESAHRINIPKKDSHNVPLAGLIVRFKEGMPPPRNATTP